MNIVVCDANIVIDLLQVDLFDTFLKLRWDIILNRQPAISHLFDMAMVPFTKIEKLLSR